MNNHSKQSGIKLLQVHYGDVYTAIAIRKGSGVHYVEAFHLPQLSMMDETGSYTRAGTGALLEYEGQRFWFLSVHLKSSCADTKKISASTGNDCETLWAQALVLKDRLTKLRHMKEDETYPIIIAGDFNRNFRQLEGRYGLWKALNGVRPDEDIAEPWFFAHPKSATRECPSRKGDTNQPIDWILVDARLESQVVENSYFETRFSYEDMNASHGGKGLSDHCPISLDIEF